MPNPEEGPEIQQQVDPRENEWEDLIRFDSPRFKLVAAGTALITTVALALSVHGKAEGLAAKCANEFPPETPGLTFENYFGVAKDPTTGKYHRTYEDEGVISILLQKEVDAYLLNPERNNRIADQVADYATVMVGRANLGDEGYKFYRPGDPGSGYFQGDPHKPVLDDFQGYGWLYRDVRDDNGKIVRQETVDGIYRFSDGTYATNPQPWTLSVSDNKSQAVFMAPEGLGLGECALEPGNGTNQGWRVEYYDFWPELGPKPEGAMQGETFDYDHSDFYYPGEMDTVKSIENHAIAKLQISSGE